MRNTRLFACLLFLISVVPVSALANIIEQRIKVDAEQAIEIEVKRGQVDIKGWEKNEFYVTGQLDELAKNYTLKKQGNRLIFKVNLPSSKSRWSTTQESNLTIYVPKLSMTEFEGISTSVEAESLLAGINFSTINGDIRVDNAANRISLKTINGDIYTSKLDGSVRIETVNGDIEDAQSRGELRFEAVNGDAEIESDYSEIRAQNVNGTMELSLEELGRARIATVNGSIDMEIKRLKDNAKIQLNSVGGEISLSLPKSTSARFEVKALSGGKVINRLSRDRAEKEKYGPSKQLNFELNQGQADIEIITVSGKVVLERI